MILDVRTKLLLLILANLTLLCRTGGWIETMIVIVFILVLFLLGEKRAAKYYVLVYLLIIVLDNLSLDILPAYLFHLLSLFIILAKFTFPTCIAATIVLRTSSVYELIHGLRKWHFPEMILLTLAVMMRFLPQIKTEAKIILQALKIRGIYLRKSDLLKQPKRYFEYFLIPLLMSLLRSSQELTLATLTKGLAVKKKATECFQSHLSSLDWGIQFWTLITMIYMISR